MARDEKRDGMMLTQPELDRRQLFFAGPSRAARPSLVLRQSRRSQRHRYSLFAVRRSLRRRPACPTRAIFKQVRCHDLSLSGFSYLADDLPESEQVIVALGSGPFIMMLARVVHHSPTIVDGQSVQHRRLPVHLPGSKGATRPEPTPEMPAAMLGSCPCRQGCLTVGLGRGMVDGCTALRRNCRVPGLLAWRVVLRDCASPRSTPTRSRPRLQRRIAGGRLETGTGDADRRHKLRRPGRDRNGRRRSNSSKSASRRASRCFWSCARSIADDRELDAGCRPNSARPWPSGSRVSAIGP